MKNLKSGSIAPATRTWFGEQIQAVALRHDLDGPDISRVRLLRYTRILINEFKMRALVASKQQVLSIPKELVDALCKRAARELIVVRQIRAAHEARRLSTETMRKLPAYAAFKDYLDENPGLIFSHLVAAVRDAWDSQPDVTASVPCSELAPIAPPTSLVIQEWFQFQIVGLARVDDMWGPSIAGTVEDDYLSECARRLHPKVAGALKNGDLQLSEDEVTPRCRWAATEALAIRRLRAAVTEGAVSKEKLLQESRYSIYREYFEEGSEWTEIAKVVAAAAESLPDPS